MNRSSMEVPKDTANKEQNAHAKRDKYQQPILSHITTSTPNPMSRSQALKYPDRGLWAKSLDAELDKIDEQGRIKWLKPGELGIIPPKTRVISLTFSFNYKRRSDGSIEERKSRASVRGDNMIPGIHYDADCTSAPMVDCIAARMVIGYSVDKGWTLEHIDVKSALLHEDYMYHKPVNMREDAREDGPYNHGKTIGILIWSLYGNTSGTYYYVKGLLKHLREIRAQLNEAEACLMCINMPSGTVIAAIAVDYFLITAETTKAMDEFAEALTTKYKIKRLGEHSRYPGWHFRYTRDGSVALS